MHATTFEAYSLGSGRVALHAKLPLVSEDSDRTWVHIATIGEWKGHHAGSFSFDVGTFKSFKRLFEAQTNSIPLTYEHPERGDGQPVPAAGWIHELEIRGPDLFALVEFTKTSGDMVRAGEYRFCSGVFDFESTDRKSGEAAGPELLEVGLTNNPFLDGLDAIQLSRVRAATNPADARRSLSMSDADLMKAVLKELGPDASLAQMQRLFDAKKVIEQIKNGEDPDAPVEEAPAEEAAASAAPPADAVELAEVVEAAPVPEEVVEAAEDELLPADPAATAALVAAVETASGMDLAGALALIQERADEFAAFFTGAEPDAAADAAGLSDVVSDAAKATVAAANRTVKLKDAEVVKLTSRVAELEHVGQCRLIDDAIKLGHVLPADRDKMVKLAKTAPGLLGDFLGSAADDPAVPTGGIVSASANSEDDGSDIDESEITIATSHFRNLSQFTNGKDPEGLRKFTIDHIRSARRGEHAQS